MKAIILAGGGGTRLWPASREACPKQLRAVVGGRTMLRVTWDRLRGSFAASDIIVTTSKNTAMQVQEELPELAADNLVVEPCRRDTAAAIGFALLHVFAADPEETFVIINSDAFVKDERTYLHSLKLADSFVRRNPDRTLVIGSRPTYAETGYGYIRAGRFFMNADRKGDYPVHLVSRFVEKPDLKTALRYVADGHFFWNMTLVVAKAATFLGYYRIHLPSHAVILEKMLPMIGRPSRRRSLERLFADMAPISIDYGILEKVSGMLVMPAEFGWMDIGHWRAVSEAGGDLMADFSDTPVISLDASGNLVRQPRGKLVALVGVEGLVVVDTPDALLITTKQNAHAVKDVVAWLKADPKLKRYL